MRRSWICSKSFVLVTHMHWWIKLANRYIFSLIIFLSRLQPRYVQRLKAIRATLEHSEFFKTHEIIGSSLLFLHDKKHASCWLIDFAKTDTLPDNIEITHKKNWEVGNHEDGYLVGLNNIIDIFSDVASEMEANGSDPSHSDSSEWRT